MLVYGLVFWSGRLSHGIVMGVINIFCVFVQLQALAPILPRASGRVGQADPKQLIGRLLIIVTPRRSALSLRPIVIFQTDYKNGSGELLRPEGAPKYSSSLHDIASLSVSLHFLSQNRPVSSIQPPRFHAIIYEPLQFVSRYGRWWSNL